MNLGGTEGRDGSKCYKNKLFDIFKEIINILKSPILFYLIMFK